MAYAISSTIAVDHLRVGTVTILVAIIVKIALQKTHLRKSAKKSKKRLLGHRQVADIRVLLVNSVLLCRPGNPGGVFCFRFHNPRFATPLP